MLNVDCIDQEVLFGDSSKLIQELPDNSIDLIVTDVPYQIGKDKYFVDQFDFNILDQFYRVLKDGCALFVWWSQYKIGIMQEEIQKRFLLKNIIAEVKRNMVCTTWDKEKLQIGWEPVFYALKNSPARININKRKFETHLIHKDVIETVVPQSNYTKHLKKIHHSQKNVDVCKTFILLQSNENDLILDPYAGYATTGIACVQSNRRFLGFEISQEWTSLGNERLQKEISIHSQI
jgi:DNA modification methylase